MQAKYVAAIGSSAGGLEALQQLLQCLRSDMQETAIVIAQHVSPSYQSRLVELLSKQTELPVANVIHGERPQGGRVYITPPDSDISFAKHRFVLTKPAADHGPRPSVDRFFSSLAAEYGAFCAAVILSGTGSDGSQGIGDVYDAGGLVIVQDSTTAKFGGMPDSAADTDLVDIIASPEEIGRHLVQWIRQGAAKHRFQTESSTGSSGKITDHIIQLLSDRTGTDFSLYKPATIRRRLEKRLAALGIDTMEQYLELLHSEPGELDELFTTILIGVTSFFRDPESFELLKKVLRQKLEDIQPQDRFRAWVPGCATGEEAYSLAIIIADILQERRDTVSVQIFATDLDERALNDARRGIYPPSSMENVTPEIKERYFSQTGEEFEVSAELRSMVLFSRHDITANPPFLRLDLVSSRNLLIYFGQELQQYVLPLFHYALKPGGLLFLGKSETIGNYGDLFETHAAKHKIFVRRFGTNPHTHRLSNFKAQIPALHTRRRPDQKSVLTIADMVKDTLYHSYEHPYVVVNNDMDVIEVVGDVREYLSIKSGAMSSGLISLIDARYELELRSLLSEAIRNNASVTGKLQRIPDDQTSLLRFSIRPLLYSGTQDALYMVVFESIPLAGIEPFVQASSEEKPTPREQELELELAATREHLQNYIEELETSTEELQSLNEELQSTNEELQSSNEELETSNEELESANEELEIAYSELKTVSDEAEQHRHQLSQSETNLRAVMENTMQAFILLDTSYRVVVYNPMAQDMFRQMTGVELEPQSLIIDCLPGQEIEAFHASFSSSLQGVSETDIREVTYSDSSLHWHQLQFTPVVKEGDTDHLVSLAILDITELKETEIALEYQRRLNQLILDTAQVGICLTNRDGLYERVNAGYCELYGYSEEELIGKPFTMVLPVGIREYAKRLYRRYLDGETNESAGEWEVLRKDGTMLHVMVGAGRLRNQDGSILKVTTVVDITEQKRAEEERNRLFTVSLDLMCILRFDGFFQHVNPAWIHTLGFSREHLKQRPFIELVHGDDRKQTLEFFKSLIEEPQHVSSFENRCVTADGSYRWLSWKIVVVPEQRLMYAVARDVTDARRAEHLLRDTQSVAKVGGWELNLVTEKFSWTDEVYRIYDTTVGELTDYTQWLEAYDPYDQSIIQEAIRKAAEYGESSDLEVQFHSRAGRHLWVRITFKGANQDGRSEKIMGTIQDITKQKHAEIENQRLSLVASRTENGVVITDQHLKIEWVNHGFENMTGYSLPEIGSRSLENVLGMMKATDEMVEEITAGTKANNSMQKEMQLQCRSGEVCWVRLDITPVEDDALGTVNWIIQIHDISQQKEFQSELIHAKNRAEEMNRLKGRFLANMSHEIRTPLNGILGMSHVIQRDAQDESVRNYAVLLEQSGQRLLRTINQVLDLSRIESRQMEMNLVRLELNELCQRICDSVEPSAREKGLDLTWHPHPEPLYISGDRYLIESILLNLLDNAIKFTDKGRISVVTRYRVVDGRSNAAVEVQDTGIGIRDDYLTQLFEPFSQESTGQARSYEGTGLGLSIAREYALMMKGDIEVTSKKAKGSTFRLLLPVARED